MKRTFFCNFLLLMFTFVFSLSCNEPPEVVQTQKLQSIVENIVLNNQKWNLLDLKDNFFKRHYKKTTAVGFTLGFFLGGIVAFVGEIFWPQEYVDIRCKISSMFLRRD